MPESGSCLAQTGLAVCWKKYFWRISNRIPGAHRSWSVHSPFPALQQLRRILWMFNFYRRFVPHTADLLLPLTSVLTDQKRKNSPIQLQPSVVTAFQTAKQTLASVVLLNYLDPSAPISLLIDTSLVAIGGTLQPTVRGKPHPLEFFVQKLSPTQRKFRTFIRELFVQQSNISATFWKDAISRFSQIANHLHSHWTPTLIATHRENSGS